MKQDKVGRNDPCPCGSGKKHKHCCGLSQARTGSSTSRLLVLVVAGLLALGAIGFVRSLATSEAANTPAAVWSPEHGHYH
jgi:hypothetical protein